MTFSTIMAEAEQKKVTDRYTQGLGPPARRVEFRDEGIVMLKLEAKIDESRTVYQKIALMDTSRMPSTT